MTRFWKAILLITLIMPVMMLVGAFGWYATAQVSKKTEEPVGNHSAIPLHAPIPLGAQIPSDVLIPLAPAGNQLVPADVRDNVGDSRIEDLRQKAALAEKRSIERASVIRERLKQSEGVGDAEVKTALRADLRVVVLEAFKARHDFHAAEVASFEKQAQTMKRKLAEREASSAEIVDRRLEDVLNPEKQWNAKSPAANQGDSKLTEMSQPGKPQTVVVPATAAKASSEAAERLRAMLNESIKVNIADAPLEQVVYAICNPKLIQFDVNKAKIVKEGDELEALHSLKAEGSLRDVLKRLLEPKDLGYIVHDSFIEITAKDDTEARPTMRCYDIAFMIKGGLNSDLSTLIQTIETAVYPDLWMTGGGASYLEIVGSLLVVTTTDPAHEQIEKLLDKLAQTNPNGPAKVGPEGLSGTENASTANVPSRETTAAEPPAGDENKLLIRRSETSVKVEGQFDGNEEILLVICDPRLTAIANTAQEPKDVKELKWTSPIDKAGEYVIEVRRDLLKIDGDGTAPGLVFQVHKVPNTVQSTSNIAFTDKDPLPNGKVVIASPKTKLLLKRKTDHVIVTVGHVELPGTLNVVPINIVIRRKAAARPVDVIEQPAAANTARQQLGTVLGKPIHESDLNKNTSTGDNLRRLLLQPLTENYCRQHKLDRAEELQTKIKDEKRRAMARLFVLPAELHRHLFEKHGGRVILSAFGPIPVDGLKKWFEEREQAGDFELTDPELKAKYRELWMQAPADARFASPDQIKAAFDPVLTDRFIENLTKQVEPAKKSSRTFPVDEVKGHIASIKQRTKVAEAVAELRKLTGLDFGDGVDRESRQA